MALQFNIRLVLDESSVDNFIAAPGVIQQSNGSLLYGYCDDFNAAFTKWFRSTDNGATWSTVAQTNDGLHNRPTRAANCPENVAVYPANMSDFQGVNVYRSTNNGGNWSNVAGWAWDNVNPFRTVICGGVVSHSLTKFIATGQFLGSSSGPRNSLALSDDAGATWTLGDMLFDNLNASYGSAIAASAGGNIYCAGLLRPTFSYWPKIKISNDRGASWHDSGSLPMPANSTTVEIRAITCVDENVVCLAGFGNSTPFADEPYVWFSSDAGASFSRLATGDIAGWPSAAAPTECSEIRRITRDAVILGISNDVSGSSPPWRLSLDQGATYPITPNVVGGGIPTQAQSLGSIVVAPNGNVLLPLYARGGSSNVRQVWLGTIEC